MGDSTLSLNGWSEQILVGSFDSMWPSLRGQNPAIHGVKIDVQGMELEVLHGMRETLQCQQPLLIVELHTGVDRQTVLSVLHNHGYIAVGEPIEPDEERGCPQYRDNCSYIFRPQR